MIKLFKDEYAEKCYAFRTYKLTFLGIPIYTACYRTTNSKAVETLRPINRKKLNVKGF